MLSSADVFDQIDGHRLALRLRQAVPELDLDRAGAVVPQPDPELVREDLVSALHRAGLVDQSPADLELGVDAESGDERLAGGHERQPHPADEIAADVDGGLAGQEHEIALVGQLGQPIDARRQHRHGLGVILGRQLDPGDLEQLRVAARGMSRRPAMAKLTLGPSFSAGDEPGLGRPRPAAPRPARPRPPG